MTPDLRPATPRPAQGAPGTRLRELAARLRRLTRELDACERAVAAAAADRYLDAAAILERTPSSLGRIGPALRAAAALIEATSLEATVQDRARRMRLHYREILERALDAAGIERVGQWPSYTLGDVLRLQVDLPRGEATLDGKRLGTVEPARLVELVASRLAGLLDRPFDPARFLAALRAAHQTVARAQDRAPGEYVDIRAVYATLRAQARDRRCSEAEFGADLYRLICASADRDRLKTDEGLAIELSPAPSAGSGLFIPMPGGGNFIAAIRFAGRQPDG